MATTHEGVDTNEGSFESRDSAADALLNRWMDAGQLSDPDGEAPSRKGSRETEPHKDDEDEDNESEELEDSDEEDSEDSDQTDDDDEDSDEDDSDDSQPVEAGDEAVVKIKVDGEERAVSVKDLKRLYGQEASLTRKSQEVAEAKKKAEDEGARFMTAAQVMLQKAQSRYAPYANLDWMVVQTQLSGEDFAQLRQEAREALEEVQFLSSEVDNVFTVTKAQREAEVSDAAKKAVEVLSSDDEGIPGWSPQVYNDIRSYAVAQKLDAGDVDNMVNPYALKLLWKAMKYDQAQKAGVTKKKAAAPKKVIKTSKVAASAMNKKAPETDAMKSLRQTGSRDAGAAALMARWGAMDSDD